MSQATKREVLAKLRRCYARAGTVYKRQLLDQAVALLGYHRKAAIRALHAGPPPPRPSGLLLGRPRTDAPETLLPIVKPIWLTAFPPCGVRLHALLPEWVPADESDHRRLDAAFRQTLLNASPRTLDRLLVPLRVAGRLEPRRLLGSLHAPPTTGAREADRPLGPRLPSFPRGGKQRITPFLAQRAPARPSAG